MNAHQSVATLARLKFTRADIEQTIPTRFEAIAREIPDRFALSGDGRQWTFDALNSEANQLAHAILRLAGGDAGRVALLLPQSPEMVVATLGILKAGKTYVALHPAMPASSHEEILDDAEPDLLVTGVAFERQARALAADRCAVLCLETIDAEESSNPQRSTTPGDPSTLFYTSGTTGRPKAVVKSHRAVLHRVWLSTEHDRVTMHDRQSLLTHCSFSASESDIFASLLQGAAVCTFDLASRSLSEFARWIDSERITLLHPPALYFRRFLATLSGAGLFPTVRLIALAGDVVLPADIERWRRHFSSESRLLHRFSTTETALLAAGHIAFDGPPPSHTIPAGHPVTDKHLRIVNEAGEDVAPGEIGELEVSSAYLADGFWDAASHTVRRFATDPRDPAARVYRTGDRGSFDAHGQFLFAGRRDHQVKIRGYRVEMREVEAALLDVRGVAEAAVMPYVEDGEQRLRAFVAPAPGTALEAAAVRHALGERLAAWKVPSRVHAIATLPTTLTGKVDRQRLEVLARELAESPVPATVAKAGAPRGRTETSIAVLFARLFRLPSVTRDADFYDLGGNSLLLTELQSEIEAALRVSIATRDLLRATTVAQVAALVEQTMLAQAPMPRDPCLVPLHRGGRRAPLFLVHGGQGQAVASPMLLDGLGADQPAYCFQARGITDGRPPRDRITEIAADYVAAMRQVQPNGPYFVGAVCAGALIAIEMTRQLHEAGEETSPLLLLDPPSPPRSRRWHTYWLRRALATAMRAASRTALGSRWLAQLPTPYEGLTMTPTWVALRLAAFRHRSVRFTGEAYVIGSTPRLQRFDHGDWRGVLDGPVHRFDVGPKHLHVIDIGNEATVTYLRQCIDLIHRWFEQRGRG